MLTARRWLVPAIALVAASCHRAEAPPSADAQPRDAGAVAASASTDEAMCAEHGVLEAVCVKCNPTLVPVFKDKGDWCDEHAFPESFCPQCHPERGGRPLADVSGGAPTAADALDGTRIRFKSEASAELAGIETSPAAASGSAGGPSIPGTIVADPSRLARVNARAAGVLREMRVDVGSVVRAGDVLAVVASPEAGEARSRVASAQARVSAARAEHERVKALLDAKIAAERELVAARREVDEAEAELAGARAAAGPFGAIEAGGSHALRSPLDGVVIERASSVGELIHPEDALLTVLDPRQLWVEIDIPEHELAGVAAGSEVEIEAPGVAPVTTRLDSISPVIDPLTRTARARASLPNLDGTFRVNARVRARVTEKGSDSISGSTEMESDPISAVSVPSGAVQRIGEHDVVFVRVAADTFELRRVKEGARLGDGVVVSGRVAPGEAVATTGSFLLKTEVLKASIGSGCCEVD